MFKKIVGAAIVLLLVLQMVLIQGFAGVIPVSAATGSSASTKSTVQITKQPTSVKVPSGSTAKVSITASGEGLKYSWYYKDAGKTKFSLTKSFKSNAYSIEMNADRNGRQVYCVVTDANGKTVKSNTVTLSMGKTLKITKQPSSVKVPSGSTAKVSITASGDGLKYSWYYKDAGKTKFSLTKSFTGNTYSIEMNSARKGRQVYCVVTDAYGKTVKSKTVTLSMGKTLKITTQPTSVKVPSGSTAKVSITASGDGLKYSWYYKDAGKTKFSLTKSFTGNTYAIEMNSARKGRQVYCVVTDAYGKTVKSKTVTLSMGKTLKITAQPTSVTAPDGSMAEVRVTASGDGLKYSWYYKDANKTKFTLTKTFTGNTYSLEMNAARNGRQVYCVVTDAYGKTVKTNTVTLSLGKSLAITAQPSNVTVPNGDKAIVTFTAVGDGLKYSWYYKDAGKTAFTLTKSFTGNTYSVEMNSARNGRQVYCVVTDTYGKTVKSNTVTLSLGKTLAITAQPSDVTVHDGENAIVTFTADGDDLKYSWYYKNVGETEFSLTNTITGNTYSIEMDSACNGQQVYCVVTDAYGKTVETDVVTLTGAHEMGPYETYLEATVEENGIERSTCAKCDYYTDRLTDKLIPIYFITVHTDNGEAPYQVGVAENGKYTLKVPAKIGYNFVAFKDAENNDFVLEGEIYNDIEITATWELDGTDTLQELVERTEAGVSEIKITADIVVNCPLFINNEVTIYADADYTLLRDPQYDGDIFVVGKNKSGESGIWDGLEPKLTLGGGAGTLTIDGNRDNLEKTVVGSAVFVSESATLNLYDGIRIANHKKLGNKRAYELGEDGEPTYSSKSVGGAAIVVLDATVNMYGGIIENNAVATEYTIVPDALGVDQSLEYNACGGAVYNRGNFNMYGGIMRGNLGLRGGAFYNNRIAYLFAGEISGNTATVYGGAVASSSTMNSNLYIGTTEGADKFIIKDNLSHRAGGALYSNTSSPIVIYGNTEFTGNRSETSGGAIYTAGALTVSGAVFDGNSCVYSGGSIYHHYTKAEFVRREISISDCTFRNNQANLGGAVILSNSGTVSTENKDGTLAYISDSTFTNNEAHNLIVTEGETTKTNNGNGGALYITRLSDCTLTNCVFTENRADNNAGAIAMHSESTVVVEDCAFVANTASYGGAVYASSGADLSMRNVQFTSNTAVFADGNTGGHGGALLIADGIATAAAIEFDNVDFTDNQAAGNGGAIYQNACEINIDETCSFTGNTASGHGGAFYLTYKNLNDEAQTKIGSKLNATNVTFENNTASTGGAVSIRTACEASFTGGKFLNNQANGTGEDTLGGGAIYVGYGAVTLNNVEATGNAASDFGGVVDSADSTVVISGGTFENNTAANGGAIHGASNSTLEITEAQFKNNTSTYVQTGTYNGQYGGGAINLYKGKITVNATTFDGNTSAYYGGAVLINNAEVSIDGQTAFENTKGATGAALYIRNASSATIANTTFEQNESSGNGVVYLAGGTYELQNVTAKNNSASKGGVVYTSGETTTINISNCALEENHATYGGVLYADSAAINFIGGTLSGNTAANGGAIFSQDGVISVEETSVKDNEVTSLGGAVYTAAGTLTIKNTTIENNAAASNGGAIYAKQTESVISGIQFIQNTSNSNGGAIDFVGCAATIDENTQFINNTAAKHGGAVYVVYDKVEVEVEGEKSTQNVPSVLQMNGGTLSGNTAMGGGAISIRTGCEATLNDCMLITNAVEGYDAGTDGTGKNDGDMEGGGAIYVGYGAVTLNNVQATGNTASDFGGVIDSVKSTVNINGGTYAGNKTNSGGVIFANINSTVNIANATMSGNESVYENTDYNSAIGGGAVYVKNSTLDIKGTTFESNITGYYAGAIYASKSTVNIADESVISGSTGSTGAALYFRDGCTTTIENTTIQNNISNSNGTVYQNAGTMTLTNVTATNNQATSGGVLFVSGGSTVLNIHESNFSNNQASNGGAVNIANGTAQITNTTFTSNTAHLGGAVYADAGTLSIAEVSFTQNSATKSASGSNGNGGAMTVVSAVVTAADGAEIKNYFSENTAENHGGAIYVSYRTNEDNTKSGGVLQMNGGLLENNTAPAGGAISARTSATVTLNGTELKNNEATSNDTKSPTGGGAIYANNNTVTLSGVVLEGNKSAYYGGAVTAAGSNFTINGNSQVKNNYGITGVALNFRDKGTNIIENVSVTGNTATANGSGVIYITGNGTLSITGLEASGNSNNNGGVIYTSGSSVTTIADSTISGNTANTNGGAICYASSGTLLIENTLMENNTAKNGGAIHSNGTGVITIDGCTMKGNTASNKGGAISAGLVETKDNVSTSKPANIVITNNTLMEANTAVKGGGAIYADAGSVVEISNSTMKANSVTGGDGGAVLVADSSVEGVTATTLTVSGSTFESNVASAKGGAISTDTDSPNLVIQVTGCTFSKNSATGQGGGAVEIQNKNQPSAEDPETVTIVFTNCIFAENQAKTTGGAIEIRTSSCAKIDGITATKNTSSGSGAVIYVTSNFSRLYLTGEVTFSENKGSTDSFAYLYNNKYTNPPKIYTTHSNSAAWVSAVKGNASSIAFDLVTLP